MPCSDLGCWVSYEDTLLSTPRSEYRPSVPGCGGGAESHSPLAFGHSLLHWRRTDCYDDRAVSPNQREPGPRCPALRGLSALGLASGGARDRSEEHTSELQSLRHLVCRLLLEKKRQ